MALPKTIKIKHPDKDEALTVSTTRYVTAKLGDLKAFGYANLTVAEVEKGLEDALAGKAGDVISKFIESDLAKDEG